MENVKSYIWDELFVYLTVYLMLKCKKEDTNRPTTERKGGVICI